MKDVGFAKFVLLVNGLVPGALLLWDAYHGQAGANPVNYAIRTTGILALIFLCLSLLVTPLRKITGLNWLFHFRRLLGLYAFFYALTHFSIFFVLDRVMNVWDTFSEMVKRPYLIVGSLGLLAMAPLAATSTNYMIKRMGSKRWQALHRLAYVAAIAGVVHFYMLVKSDIRLPVAYGIVVGILLGYRAVGYSLRLVEKSGRHRRHRRGTLERTTPRRANCAGNPGRQDISPGSARSKRLPVRLSARTIPDVLAADRRQGGLAVLYDRIHAVQAQATAKSPSSGKSTDWFRGTCTTRCGKATY